MARTGAGNHRPDSNQAEIIAGLRREFGRWAVQSLSMVGDGCPDILVGGQGCNALFEIKDGSRPPSEQALTDKEALWHRRWPGKVDIVRDLDEAAMYCRHYFGRERAMRELGR